MTTPIPTIDPICGLAISDVDQAETQRLLARFHATHAPVVDDEDELRFALAEDE